MSPASLRDAGMIAVGAGGMLLILLALIVWALWHYFVGPAFALLSACGLDHLAAWLGPESVKRLAARRRPRRRRGWFDSESEQRAARKGSAAS